MKKLLFAALAVLTINACSYGDDIDTLQGQVGQLQRDLMQSDLNNAHLVAALQERAAQDLAAAEARVAELAASLTTQAQEVLDAAVAELNSDIATVVADLEVLEVAFATAQADSSNEDAIKDLAAALDALENDLEDLEDDLEDLEDEVDDIDTDVNTITWTPTFSTQTAVFTQIGTSLSGTTSRVIAIGTTTATVVINAVEHQHNVDINGDRDQADSIRRSRIDTTYTGTVSGSTLQIGTHTVTGTLTPWVVVDNN